MMVKNIFGFTLLEILIAITILSTMMLFSNQTIQNSLKSKLKIQNKVEDMSSVRTALKIMKKDINLAFHYQDIESEMKEQLRQLHQSSSSSGASPSSGGTTGGSSSGASGSGASSSSGAGVSDPQKQQVLQQNMSLWLQKDPDRKDPTTHFYGTENEIHVPTMNSQRVSEDLQQADFVKVNYFIVDCQTGSEKSKCLARGVETLIDGDITKKSGAYTILLEGITEFKLRYLGEGKQDFVSQWNSKSTEEGIKDRFPDAIEISLAISHGEGKKQRTVSMQVIASVYFPNNPKKQQNPQQPVQPGSGKI